MTSWILFAIIMGISFLMTMTGRGGGNFYVLTLILAGYSMGISASTGQFIMMCSSIAAALLFGKKKMNDWKLTAVLGGLVFLSALSGGFFGDLFQETILRLIFAVFMFLAAILMLKKNIPKKRNHRFYVIILKSSQGDYHVNLLTTIPVVVLTGFVSGMVGVSGGSFLVPLMLLTMNVPMRVAVGTSTTLVAVSASAGFIGHMGAGVVDLPLAIPLAIGGVAGAVMGAKTAIESKPRHLKYLFAATQLLAAIIMIVKTLHDL